MFQLRNRLRQIIWFLLPLLGVAACNNTGASAGKKGDSLVTAVEDSAWRVAPKPLVDTFKADSTKKYIYLTFDDGPQPGTADCFNICKAQGIKASFFMVGIHQRRKKDGKELVTMIRNGYPQFLLANHSYDHAAEKYIYFYQHPQMAFQTFLMAQDTLQIPKKIIRLPGNSAWVRDGVVKSSHLVSAVTHLLDSAGFNVIGWDLEWNFSHKTARPVQTAEKLAADVDSAFAAGRGQVKNNIVILTHDRMFQRHEDSLSLVRFISLLKRNPNYVFETVDHYPGLKK